MNIGEKIKSARLAKGLTQQKLGELIGAKHNSVSDWEKGKSKPDMDTFELLCGVLDVTPNYFLGKKSDEEYGDSVGKLMLEPETIEMIVKFRSLPDDDKKAIRQIISSLSGNRG